MPALTAGPGHKLTAAKEPVPPRTAPKAQERRKTTNPRMQRGQIAKRGHKGSAGPNGSCGLRSRHPAKSTSSRFSAILGPLISAEAFHDQESQEFTPVRPGHHQRELRRLPVRTSRAEVRSGHLTSLLLPLPVRCVALPAETVLQLKVPRCLCAWFQAPPDFL